MIQTKICSNKLSIIYSAIICICRVSREILHTCEHRVRTEHAVPTWLRLRKASRGPRSASVAPRAHRFIRALSRGYIRAWTQETRMRMQQWFLTARCRRVSIPRAIPKTSGIIETRAENGGRDDTRTRLRRRCIANVFLSSTISGVRAVVQLLHFV